MQHFCLNEGEPSVIERNFLNEFTLDNRRLTKLKRGSVGGVQQRRPHHFILSLDDTRRLLNYLMVG
jgi:hypothetical protein